MRNGLKQARGALRRGDLDGTLVILWNELEPARLAGDRRALRTIQAFAAAVAGSGDAGQATEAERLLAEVEEAAAAGSATSALEGEFRPAGYERAGDPAGYDVQPQPGGYHPGDEPLEEPEPQTGIRLGGVVWLLILLGIIAINILGQTRE